MGHQPPRAPRGRTGLQVARDDYLAGRLDLEGFERRVQALLEAGEADSELRQPPPPPPRPSDAARSARPRHGSTNPQRQSQDPDPSLPAFEPRWPDVDPRRRPGGWTP